MSACNAMEDALGVTVDEPIRRLRGSSTAASGSRAAPSVFLLHAPDFLGYESAPAMARGHPELVAQGSS